MFRCIRTGQGVMRAVPYYSGYSQESAVRQEVLFRASGHTINPVPRGANAVNWKIGERPWRGAVVFCPVAWTGWRGISRPVRGT